ncbi:helix-turn-helix transcriptional regulator [Streptomyces mexicanus]|uniref:helix-turn-helix transcriptional regulator n=1 Tax=Streptomyces mexicanus TaxID=178566 RepID=UPI0031EDF1BB
MSPAPHPEHGPEALCPTGTALYERALREGWLPAAVTDEAPCLVECGLLHPDADTPDRMRPVPAATALHRMLRASAERVAAERRREARLTESFAPLLRLDAPHPQAPETTAIRLISGIDRINEAITATMAEASRELLCIQPSFRRTSKERAEIATAISLARDQALLDRGARIRTLYQHTHRHLPLTHARYERLTGDVEARTLDEVTDRLIIVDRSVAYLPANADGTLALEVTHPVLVSYFVTAFERFWRLATPMYPTAAPQPSPGGVTARQRAIAGLLVEGHTDTVIAERLGMNVRTAREHIAKLAAALGSTSRAQLGYLIGRSGILDHREH